MPVHKEMFLSNAPGQSSLLPVRWIESPHVEFKSSLPRPQLRAAVNPDQSEINETINRRMTR